MVFKFEFLLKWVLYYLMLEFLVGFVLLLSFILLLDYEEKRVGVGRFDIFKVID